MKQEELEKAIEEGVEKAILNVLCYIAIVIIIIELIVLGLIIFDTYFVEDCFETGECGMPEPSCFPYENLRCEVKVGNSTAEWGIGHFSICGYQEANAYFEHIKPLIKRDLKEHQDKNWQIKYLECN